VANVSILGDVQKPGDYAYVEGQTVRAVIERAGGLKKGPEAIYLYVMRVLDGKARRCLASPDTPTKPWDLVTVEKEGGPTLQVFPVCPEN